MDTLPVRRLEPSHEGRQRERPKLVVMKRQGHVFRETYRVRSVSAKSPAIYRSEHFKLGKPVEIYELFTSPAPEALSSQQSKAIKKSQAALHRKVKILAGFSHPRLTPVLDIFKEEETVYLVTEIPNGLSLRQLVESSVKPLDEDVLISMTEHLLKLLVEVQEAFPNQLLGCLNPDTIFVNSKGRIQLSGQSFLPPRNARTELYLPPEAQLAESHNLSFDLYSLGALLYFAMTGAEIPPVLNRITKNERPADPMELKLSISSRYWALLCRFMSISIDQRPQGARAALDALESCRDPELKETEPDATWLPEQEGHLLASSKPYGPFQASDWILKMVQAAVLGKARGLDVNQGRRWCQVELRLAAPDVPSPRKVLQALVQETSLQTGVAAEIACGLRMVGEFRDFSLVLDDWKQSWVLECKAGKISCRPTESLGRSGLILQVHYNKHDRAKRTAEDMLALTRKTRLCQIPLTVCGRPLEFSRPIEPTPPSSETIEVYLASVSLPQSGLPYSVKPNKPKLPPGSALTSFHPGSERRVTCHLDVRCYVAAGSKDGKLIVPGSHFERRPSRVLWYHNGVLCGHQNLPKLKALQFDLHLEATDFPTLNTGLTVLPPEWVPKSQLREDQVQEIMKVIKFQLKETWDDEPTQSSPLSQALVGALGAPLLLVFLGGTGLGGGLLLLKKAALATVFKSGAAAGGVAGYTSASSHLERVRKICLKAMATFEAEEAKD